MRPEQLLALQRGHVDDDLDVLRDGGRGTVTLVGTVLLRDRLARRSGECIELAAPIERVALCVQVRFGPGQLMNVVLASAPQAASS